MEAGDRSGMRHEQLVVGDRVRESPVDPGKGSASVKCDREPQEGLGQRKDVAVTRVSLASMQKSVLVEARILEAGDPQFLGEGIA